MAAVGLIFVTRTPPPTVTPPVSRQIGCRLMITVTFTLTEREWVAISRAVLLRSR
jgi:hypothetical protein